MAIIMIQDNKKARFDFTVVDTYEAGIVLRGSEVKSLREKNVQLKDSYIVFIGEEAFLQNAHISEYKSSSYNNHHPERTRKLLLHREELSKIAGAIQEKGLTCVPLKIYFKDGKVKVEIALAKGKKVHDKRESIKQRDAKREVRQATQRQRRA